MKFFLSLQHLILYFWVHGFYWFLSLNLTSIKKIHSNRPKAFKFQPTTRTLQFFPQTLFPSRLLNHLIAQFNGCAVWQAAWSHRIYYFGHPGSKPKKRQFSRRAAALKAPHEFHYNLLLSGGFSFIFIFLRFLAFSSSRHSAAVLCIKAQKITEPLLVNTSIKVCAFSSSFSVMQTFAFSESLLFNFHLTFFRSSRLPCVFVCGQNLFL